jgi:hypothetical protein
MSLIKITVLVSGAIFVPESVIGCVAVDVCGYAQHAGLVGVPPCPVDALQEIGVVIPIHGIDIWLVGIDSVQV